MAKTVQAIVRGPQPYFADGRLHAPGSIVDEIPADQVSDENFREVKVEVENKAGDLVPRKVKVPVKFRPVGSIATRPSTPDPAAIASGNPDRLNTSDFLKKSVEDIEATIASGAVDDHLSALEQAEIAAKGRKGVKDAIRARLSEQQQG